MTMTPLLTALVSASLLTGSLCIERDCRTVQLQGEQQRFAVVAADQARSVTVVTGDGSEIILGRIAAGATEWTLDRSLLGSASIRAASRHSVPIPPIHARIRRREDNVVWNVALTPPTPAHQVTLAALPGAYDVNLQTDSGRLRPSEAVTIGV